MKTKFLHYFMSNAVSASQLSTCPRAAVGAIVVRYDGKVIGTGYNGSPRGLPHCTDVGCYIDQNGSCIRSVHAEVNALLGLSGLEVAGSSLFCTHKPCLNCTKLILNSGLTFVYFLKQYNSGDLANEMIEASKDRITFIDLGGIYVP